MEKLHRKFDDFEQAIRSGRIAEVRRELTKLRKRRIPRRQLLRFASLARRVNAPDLGLRALSQLVRPLTRSADVASPEETAEYAANLIRVGGFAEALTLLASVDERRAPRVALFKAYAYIGQWKYRESLPFLHAYLKAPGLTDYERLVGKVNLAAGLVYEREAAAGPTLKELVEETERQSHRILLVNVLNLAAQFAIWKKDWRDARAHLAHASQLAKDSGALEEFFLRKWNAIVDYLESNHRNRRDPLANIRKEAKQLSHWESFRDVDQWEALAQRDELLLHRLWFGTPYESYRSRILDTFGPHNPLPTSYVWTPGGERSPAFLTDLQMGEIHRQGKRVASLKVGQALHRMLTVLCSDFYRPFRTAALHAQVFPGEYYNPDTSPVRIRQAVCRLRHWFEEERIPLTVIDRRNTYSLETSGGVGIEIQRSTAPTARNWALGILKRRFGTRPFSIHEASTALELSPRSTLRALSSLVEQGTLKRIGKAAATRYCLLAETLNRAS